jgi:ligand-binding sensor protein
LQSGLVQDFLNAKPANMPIKKHKMPIKKHHKQTRLLDLIDFRKLDTLLEGFNKSTGFVTAIVDLEGNVLSQSGWRQICTDFHRVNPETAEKCNISDTHLANKLAGEVNYHFYQCLNGLIDVAVPIIIKGEHIANLFSGQFFLNEPDKAFFQQQADKYGFDKDKYLEALEKVPVVPEENVRLTMDFLLNMASLISEMTLQELEQRELNKALRESEERFRVAQEMSPDGFTILHPVRNEKGDIVDFTFIYQNQTIARINGTDPQKVIGTRLLELFPNHRGLTVFETYLHVANTGKPEILEEVYIGAGHHRTQKGGVHSAGAVQHCPGND